MTITTLLRSTAVLLGVCAFGVGCTARTEQVGTERGAEADVDGVPPTPAPPIPAPAPSQAVPDASIHGVKQPGSTFAVGTQVHVSGLGVRVMATSGSTLFLQEAGDEGYCENGTAAVAHRAIAATTTKALPEIAVGQRVEVTGTIAVAEGRRVIVDATIVVVDGDVRPYQPHCERDASSLLRPELEGLFVITAGTTDGVGAPESAEWLLATCFGDAVRVGTRMTKYADWSASWHSVSGIVVGGGSSVRLEPRSAADIHGQMHDDVCL